MRWNPIGTLILELVFIAGLMGYLMTYQFDRLVALAAWAFRYH